MNEIGETVCRPSKPKTGPVVLAVCNYGGFYSDFFVFKYFCVSKTLLFFLKDCGAVHTHKVKVVVGQYELIRISHKSQKSFLYQSKFYRASQVFIQS